MAYITLFLLILNQSKFIARPNFSHRKVHKVSFSSYLDTSSVCFTFAACIIQEDYQKQNVASGRLCA